MNQNTTFTPEGQPEAPKICWWCKELKPATKYGMKYEDREIDGVKTRCRVRNSSCLACKDSKPKEAPPSHRIDALEEEMRSMKAVVEAQKKDNEKLQLLIFKLSGEIELIKFKI
jgi:hypothetical protein